MYRFKNKDDEIIYVGRTRNLHQRFLNHSYLTEDVKKIEYVEYDSEAEMAWKEIYYINLYFNELSRNDRDVYLRGDKMPEFPFGDKWKIYKFFGYEKPKVSDDKIYEDFEKYIKNAPKYNYKELIHILDHKKLNSIGDDTYALSEKWYKDNTETGGITQLRWNTTNYFRNIAPKKWGNVKGNILWTTYIAFKEVVQEKGFTKGFVAPYTDVPASFGTKEFVAYLCNDFYRLAVPLDETPLTVDEYAITLLVKFLFSGSALKNGKDIYLYLPSKRMRDLLTNWIEENSVSDVA